MPGDPESSFRRHSPNAGPRELAGLRCSWHAPSSKYRQRPNQTYRDSRHDYLIFFREPEIADQKSSHPGSNDAVASQSRPPMTSECQSSQSNDGSSGANQT